MNTIDKNLTQCLKDLAAGHSYMAVHTELLRLMKDEYSALKSFFDVEAPKKKRTPVVAEVEAPAPVAVVAPVQEKLLANTKIRIIKKAASSDGASPKEPHPSTAPVEQKPRMDSKELKAWQKEQEAKKLAELTAAGTNPESLLTPESIKRWVEDEGRTFAYVAREYVGLPEATVADYAKSN